MGRAVFFNLLTAVPGLELLLPAPPRAGMAVPGRLVPAVPGRDDHFVCTPLSMACSRGSRLRAHGCRTLCALCALVVRGSGFGVEGSADLVL